MLSINNWDERNSILYYTMPNGDCRKLALVQTELAQRVADSLIQGAINNQCGTPEATVQYYNDNLNGTTHRIWIKWYRSEVQKSPE